MKWFVLLIVAVVIVLFGNYVAMLLSEVRCPKCGRKMKSVYDNERDCEVYICDCGHKMYVCG